MLFLLLLPAWLQYQAGGYTGDATLAHPSQRATGGGGALQCHDTHDPCPAECSPIAFPVPADPSLQQGQRAARKATGGSRRAVVKGR